MSKSNSSKNSQLSEYSQQIQRTIAKNFIEKLKEIKQDLNSSNSELSDGLDIARPTLIKFLNQDESDQRLLTNINPAKIYNLWETLTDPEKTEGCENRKSLQERGPNELLKAAGFLPINKSLIEIESDQYPQLFQIIMLLSNRECIDFNTYMTITQQFIDNLIERIPDVYDPKKIFRNDLFTPKTQKTIEEKYNKALNNFGEKNRNKKELITLASTIMLNQVTKPEQLSFWDFNDINYEFNQLTQHIYNDEKWQDIYMDFVNKSQKEEKEFFTNSEPESSNSQAQKGYIPTSESMTEVKISFRSNIEEETSNDNKFLNFTYISRNSLFNNILITITRHLGIRHICEITKISNESLNDNMDSLIKSTSILKLKDKNHYFQGDWVSQDLLKSSIRSLILASRKMIHFYFKDENDTKYKLYQKLVSQLATQRELLTKVLDASQTFQKDEILDISSLDKNIEKIDLMIEQISSQSDVNELEKMFLIEFYHNKIIISNYKIRLYHILGNVEKAKATVKDIEEWWNKERNKKINKKPLLDEKYIQKLDLSRGLVEIEKKLLNISLGTYNFGNKDSEDIQTIDAYQNHIKYTFEDCQNNQNNDILGYSTGMTSLRYIAESYFLVGQELFYNHDDKLSYKEKYQDSNETAYLNFLHATYFFLRIGFNQRVKQCLAFAGRSKTRLKANNYAQQLIELLKYIHGSSQSFEKDLTCNLFYAEYKLLIENNAKDAIGIGLRGVKESLRMASPRRATEYLYLIYCCSKELKQQRIIRNDLIEYFFNFSELSEDKIKKENLQTTLQDHLLNENYREDQLLNIVISLFRDIINESKNDLTWGEVGDRFKETAIKVWDKWYKVGSNNESTNQHPVSKKMEENSFLLSPRIK